jgi:hypothetical protein
MWALKGYYSRAPILLMPGWGMAGAGEATLKPVAPVTGAPEEELPKNYRLLTYYDENGRPIAGIMVDQHVYPAK